MPEETQSGKEKTAPRIIADGADLLIDYREVARILSVSPRTVWKLVSLRKLDRVSIGRSTRFRKSQVLHIVEHGVSLK